MIKAIAVDDEWYNLVEISDLLENTGLIKVIGKYQNPLKALKEVRELMPEVAFIDVEMCEIDGLTLAKRLLDINPEILIIFVTSWDKYAIDAFDINATDYLLKPIRIDRFNRMIEKVVKIINKKVEIGNIRIQMFGNCEVCINGVSVKWQRAKAEELFYYLLLNHGSYVHKDTILEELWANHDPSKALQILQTTISRIRNIFAQYSNQINLDYSINSYRLLVNDDVWCDYIELEKALNNYDIGLSDSFTAVECVGNSFSKGVLKQQGYLWICQREEELRKKLVKHLNEIVNWYRRYGLVRDELRILELICILIPYEDDMNYQYIKTLKKIGNDAKALNHFKWLEKTLIEDYGLSCSKKISELVC